MNHGFIKVAAITPKIKVADVEYNTNACIQLANEAYENGVKLAIFPELCLTGYTCSDLFYSTKLLNGALEGLRNFVYSTSDMDMISVIGLPLVCSDKLYNCAAVICSGQLLGIVPKTNLPNYAEFYEVRQFTPAGELNFSYNFDDNIVMFGTKQIFVCRNMPEFKLGIEICEDLWSNNTPSNICTAAGATIVANLSASNEVIGKEDYRRSLVTMQSARTCAGYIYSSCGYGESTTDIVFSGHCLICENGSILNERLPFDFDKGNMIISEIDVNRLVHDRRKMNTYSTDTHGKEFCEIEFELGIDETLLTRHVSSHPFVPSNMSERDKRCNTILSIQSQGLAKRIEAAYAKKIVVGISGGLDSCLALLCMVKAIDFLKRPRTDIIAVTMPCFGTTARTKNNATILCEQLGVDFRSVNITDSVNKHFEDIGHNPEVHNVVFENCQARERTQVIMDIANAEGGFVVGTGDLSELALGWATYNGDHMSMYGVNASIPKTLVRHIVRYYADIEKAKGNNKLASALYDILDTPVSPELLPADENGEISQKTEDLVGPYEIHDFYLYYMVRYGFTPSKLFRMAKYAFDGEYSDEILLHWLEVFLKRFFAQQFKRSCLPDGPKVGSISLSPRGDWRMPSDASSTLWLQELQELKAQLQ